MPRTIDPNDYLPRYYQLANILRESISDGKMDTHQPIPSERQLETIYNVSRPTIRQAIDLLVRQGFLYREHGKGTFVSPQKLQKGISELTSFTEDMKQRGIVPGQKILELGPIQPPENVRAHMDLPADCGPLLRIAQHHYGTRLPLVQLDAQKIPFHDGSYCTRRGSIERYQGLQSGAGSRNDAFGPRPDRLRPGSPIQLNT